MSLPLLEFCRRNNVTLSSLAKLADLDKGSLYKIAKGERGFTPETAAAIERATAGVVTPSDLTRVRMEWLKANPPQQKKSLSAEEVA